MLAEVEFSVLVCVLADGSDEDGSTAPQPDRVAVVSVRNAITAASAARAELLLPFLL